MPKHTILVRSGPDDDSDARRFIQILCVLEIIYRLATCVLRILHFSTFYGSFRLFDMMPVTNWVGLGMLVALALALRRGGRRVAVVAVAGLLLLVGQFAEEMHFWLERDVALGNSIDVSIRDVLIAYLPFLVMIGAALRRVHHELQALLKVERWALVAAAWCLTSLVCHGHPMICWLIKPGSFSKVVAGIVVALPLCIVGGLWTRPRWVRIPALIMACIVLVTIWDESVSNWLTGVCTTLSASITNSERAILMATACASAVASSAYQALPWLLIAWYAAHVSVSELPDDGSPWPRRYCGKCLYNLHGAVRDQCPECGVVLSGCKSMEPVQKHVPAHAELHS